MARTELKLVRRGQGAHFEETERKTTAIDTPIGGTIFASAMAWFNQRMDRMLGVEGSRRRRHVNLMEVLPLGARGQLMLVSCEGERFLVGTGPNSVTALVRVRPEMPPPYGSESSGKKLVQP
jgi:hypothetical protein